MANTTGKEVRRGQKAFLTSQTQQQRRIKDIKQPIG
jgi:hypothetical protein